MAEAAVVYGGVWTGGGKERGEEGATGGGRGERKRSRRWGKRG